MATGTLDLSKVEEDRQRLEDPEAHARRIVDEVLADAQGTAARQLDDAPEPSDPDQGESWDIAHHIVEEVLAAEAALDSSLGDDTPHDRDWSLADVPAATQPRGHLVLLSADEPLVLVPGPVYEPGSGSWTPRPDRLGVLVDEIFTSARTLPQHVGAVLRDAADSPGMPGTRWMLLGLLWMAAFAGIVPFAFATIGNSLDLEIDLFGEEAATQPAAEQPADPTGGDNPSVEGSGS